MRRTITVVLCVLMGSGACAPEGSDRAPTATTPRAAPERDEGPVVRVVAPGGDDRAPGTEQAPWRTLAASLPRLRPGDELLVRAGTYREQVRDLELRSGSSEAPITVRAWPDEEPVLAGLLWLDRPSYWTIRGLRITWDDDAGGREDHMVKLTDGVGWRFEGNELSDAESFAALLVASSRDDEPADWTVTGNCIHSTKRANDTNQDHLVYVNTGLESGPGRVGGNVLFDAPNGAGVKLGGSSEDEGTAGVVVEHNTIWGAAQSILVSWRSSRNELVANVLGDTSRNYGAIRGYRLTGEDNVARDNIAADTTQVLLNDSGYEPITDAGGNRLLTAPPAWDATSCNGFHPGDELARVAGHLATPGAG